jgi:hypothetical protein
MARLTGVPCSVACLRVLDSSIKEKGIPAPVTWELAKPSLVELRVKWRIEMVKTLVWDLALKVTISMRSQYRPGDDRVKMELASECPKHH